MKKNMMKILKILSSPCRRNSINRLQVSLYRDQERLKAGQERLKEARKLQKTERRSRRKTKIAAQLKKLKKLKEKEHQRELLEFYKMQKLRQKQLRFGQKAELKEYMAEQRQRLHDEAEAREEQEQGS